MSKDAIKEAVNDTAVEAVEAAAEAQAKTKTQKFVKGMAAKLAKCPKVTIKVPIDKQNEKDKYVEVQINGYVYQIERGKEVSVPAPIKKLLERGKYL